MGWDGLLGSEMKYEGVGKNLKGVTEKNRKLCHKRN